MSGTSAEEMHDQRRQALNVALKSLGTWQETATGEHVRIDRSTHAPRSNEPRHRISVVELKRRLWHMSPGLLAIPSALVPHKDPLGPIFLCVVLSLMATITALLLWQYHTIRREGEQSILSGVFGYAWSVVLPMLLFPAHAEIGLLVLGVLAFGDGMATLCGLLFGGARLPWNPRKTWVGTLCFVGFGGVLSSLAYWGESQPHASWSAAFACGLTATVAAALAESWPSRINDNVRVGVTAAVTGTLMHAWVVGL